MSSSHSEAPTEWPLAAKKVKHMPPPTINESTDSSSASITASLSLTFEPPMTATKGFRGLIAQPAENLNLAVQ